jgi:hypothetical protein
MRNLARKPKARKRRKFAQIDRNVWNLEFDPWSHSENEELYLLSFPEGCRWDIFNIRTSHQMLAFHIGMKWQHIKTGTTKEIVDYVNHLGFHVPVIVTTYVKKGEKE